ncbi:hypothetical protein NPIL_195091 [Nephila pilipes]|uniref:Uncharacterized protein n=1 Tax=Nephila pilipes TaxID=299642 RepID=A0A8X6PMB1_NEPPI|nr:hypothetical protein NPIL_195091 [Nephila pilipes]
MSDTSPFKEAAKGKAMARVFHPLASITIVNCVLYTCQDVFSSYFKSLERLEKDINAPLGSSGPFDICSFEPSISLFTFTNASLSSKFHETSFQDFLLSSKL